MRSIIDFDYKNIFGIEVHYDFYEGSEPVMYYGDGSGHPGDNTKITIEKLLITKYYSPGGDAYDCHIDISKSASGEIYAEAENEIEKELERCG